MTEYNCIIIKYKGKQRVLAFHCESDAGYIAWRLMHDLYITAGRGEWDWLGEATFKLTKVSEETAPCYPIEAAIQRVNLRYLLHIGYAYFFRTLKQAEKHVYCESVYTVDLDRMILECVPYCGRKCTFSLDALPSMRRFFHEIREESDGDSEESYDDDEVPEEKSKERCEEKCNDDEKGNKVARVRVTCKYGKDEVHFDRWIHTDDLNGEYARVVNKPVWDCRFIGHKIRTMQYVDEHEELPPSVESIKKIARERNLECMISLCSPPPMDTIEWSVGEFRDPTYLDMFSSAMYVHTNKKRKQRVTWGELIRVSTYVIDSRCLTSCIALRPDEIPPTHWVTIDFESGNVSSSFLPTKHFPHFASENWVSLNTVLSRALTKATHK